MDNEEIEELFGQLRTAGYIPMPYETDIPTYTNRVHCGPATEVGDTNQENDDWYSHGVKGQESDIYKIQNLKYKQQDIIRNLS